MKYTHLLLIGFLGISACRSSSTTQDVQPPSAQPAAPAPQQTVSQKDAASDDGALTAELSRYIACYNRTMPRTNDSIARYESWVTAAGPTCKENYISYGLYTLYDDSVALCNQAAAEGAVNARALPELEKDFKEYADVNAALVPLAQKMSDYYDMQRYREDNCAGAQAFHGEFSALKTRYEKARDAIAAGIDREKTALDQRALARMEKESGKNLDWHLRKYLMTAQDLVEKGIVQAPDGALAKETYLAHFSALETDYNALDAYALSHVEEIKARYMESIVGTAAKGLYKTAYAVKLDLAEGKQPEANLLNNVVDAYNRFIDSVNNHRY